VICGGAFGNSTRHELPPGMYGSLRVAHVCASLSLSPTHTIYPPASTTHISHVRQSHAMCLPHGKERDECVCVMSVRGPLFRLYMVYLDGVWPHAVWAFPGRDLSATGAPALGTACGRVGLTGRPHSATAAQSPQTQPPAPSATLTGRGRLRGAHSCSESTMSLDTGLPVLVCLPEGWDRARARVR
jgi:hypothetical protein